MAIRKDANTLTSTERAEFVAAVMPLKASGIYDRFVLRHANADMNSIHSCPAFLPWHRRFLYDFEQELQRASGNPNLSIPYWNWPSGGIGASMWEDDLLGGDGDNTEVVRTGPFRSGRWTVVNSAGNPAGALRRSFGQTSSAASSLPSMSQIESVLDRTPYDRSPWNRSERGSFRNQLEGWEGPNLHNRGHVWVGGSMLPMTSPNDPVFFMHHCMVDKLWHEWQLRFPNQSYLPNFGGRFGQNLTDPMDSTPAGGPGERPIDVLDSAALGISYDQHLPGTPSTGASSGAPSNDDLGVTLAVNGSPHRSGIGAPGEEDLFRFSVTDFGDYTLETSGPSDTVMALYGPHDPSDRIAINDDINAAERNYNSRIQQNLSAGDYWLRVTLYDPSATGDYMIEVKNGALTSVPQIEVGGEAVNAAISAANESDLFRFEVTNSGTYTIETTGETDTFLTLFGPNNQRSLIVSNDDSEFSLNARIRRNLSPGEYFARVRHYSALGTGGYRIRVIRS